MNLSRCIYFYARSLLNAIIIEHNEKQNAETLDHEK